MDSDVCSLLGEYDALLGGLRRVQHARDKIPELQVMLHSMSFYNRLTGCVCKDVKELLDQEIQIMNTLTELRAHTHVEFHVIDTV